MSTTAIYKKSRTFVPLNVIAVVLLVACSSCATLPLHVKPPRGNEGVVYLYLQPFPQSADRLTFTLAGVSAVRDDGQEVPLSLRLAELKGKELTRQRLLCQGVLPPGSYTGFSFNTAKASLQAEEGDANLLVPEKPVTDVFPVSGCRTEGRGCISRIQLRTGRAERFQLHPRIFLHSRRRSPLPQFWGMC